jgi:hypothetical protein
MKKQGLKDKAIELKDSGFEKVSNFCQYVGSNIKRATQPIKTHYEAFMEKLKGKECVPGMA